MAAGFLGASCAIPGRIGLRYHEKIPCVTLARAQSFAAGSAAPSL
jgi:hypothetical protein